MRPSPDDRTTSDNHYPGKKAETPTEIPAKGWWQISKRIFRQVGTDHVQLISAGVAFYAFLALIPALSATVSLYGLLMTPAEVQSQLNQLVALMPQQAHKLLRGILESMAEKEQQTLGISLFVSVLLSLWSANKGTTALIEGMNIVYNERDTRNFFKRKLLTYTFTLIGFIGFGLCMLLIVGISAFVDRLGLPPLLATLITFLRWPILAAIFMLALALVCKYAPYRRSPEFRWVTVGSVCATLIWLLVSYAFSVYVDNFGGYDETYGSLAAVVLCLLWLFLTSSVLLVGVEINAEMEHQTASDTTVGADRPMGKRGAYYADNLPKHLEAEGAEPDQSNLNKPTS